MSELKPTIYTFLIVGLMAVLFIVLAKYIVNQYNIAFLADFVNAI